MARNFLATGSISLSGSLANAESGDYSGDSAFADSMLMNFNCVESLPALVGVDGFINAALVTCAAGEWHFADPIDPFQGMSDSKFNSHLFTPVGEGLKFFAVQNLDLLHDVTIKRAAANGLPIFTAANTGVVLKPNGFHVFADPIGAITGALVRGSNDILAITVSAGSPVCKVWAVFGPHP